MTKFDKNGVSEDGTQLMTIGLPSTGADSVSGWTKSVYERKCPGCGSTELYWSIFWAGDETSNWGTFPGTGKQEGSSAEGTVECGSCDRDFSVQGNEHITGSTVQLNRISGPDTSSKEEAYELLNSGLDYSGGSSSSSSGSSCTTHTKGFDKDKPFQGYFQIDYVAVAPGTYYTSTIPPKQIYLDFSADSYVEDNGISIFKTIWVNNQLRQNSANILPYLRLHENDLQHLKKYYLKGISLKYTTPKDEDLYESDTDDSSNKMLLANIGFRAGDSLNPKTIDTNGKSILENINSVLETSTYVPKLVYGTRRIDDAINFYVKGDKITFTFREDDAKFIGLDNIEYSPVNNMFNSAYRIYKKGNKDGTAYYRFINTRFPESVLEYGEKCDVEVMDDDVSTLEAYYEARINNKKLTNELTTSYTIEWEGIPPIEVGDYVTCVMDNEELSGVKQVKSLEHKLSNDDAVNVITTVGLDEMDPIIRGKVEQQQKRRIARQQKTVYSGGSKYDVDIRTEFTIED